MAEKEGWEEVPRRKKRQNGGVTDCNISYEKIIVLTKRLGKLNEEIQIEWRNQSFKVHVSEDLEDWTPSFLEASPDSDQHDRNSTDCPTNDRRYAWEVKSRNDDEREEGEIVEHNHGGTSSKIGGEGQTDGTNSKNVMGGNGISNENEAEVVGDCILSPTRSDEVIPDSLNGPKWLEHDNGLPNLRPRKRARSDFEINQEVNAHNIVSVLPGVDLQSLSFDLNIAPSANNPRSRRCRGIRPSDLESNMAGGMVSELSGTFRFGCNDNLEDSVGGPDPALIEDEIVVPGNDNEIEETVVVGKMIGIDVEEFRDQVQVLIEGEGVC
ncbi:hypothetical protein R6Q59_005925 [Mikania micrantha]